MKRSELLAKRAALTQERDTILAKGAGTITGEELDRAEGITREIDLLDADLRQAPAPEEPEDPESRRSADPTVATRGLEDLVSTSRGDDERSAVLPGQRRKYADMFGATRDRAGFRDADEFLSLMARRMPDPRLLKRMIEGVGSEGGFAVPDEFAGQILDNALEGEIVRKRATVWPMKTNRRKVPRWGGTDHTNDLYGGLVTYWTAEASEFQATEPELEEIELVVEKLYCLTSASNELAEDGLSIGAQLQAALTKAINWKLDYGFLQGTGVGQPLGVLNSDALIEVPKEVGQAAGTVLYTNLSKMFARMHPALLQKAEWFANSTTLPQLLQLSLPIGTAGSHVPVLREGGPTGFTILTRPVTFTEKLPVVGTAGDIIFADFSQYVIGMRKEVTVEESKHIYFTSDKTAYRGIVRAMGMPIYNEPTTPKHGDTVSAFVALAERA